MVTIGMRCRHCGGNLLQDREERGGWQCLQCARPLQRVRPPAPDDGAPAAHAGAACAMCNGPLPAGAQARRRYCSDRCRMRAARGRWGGRVAGPP